MGLFYNIFFAFFSSIGAFLFGYDSGIISSVLQMEYFKIQFNASETMKGAIVSTLAGGCFFGAAGAGWFNDRWGRKRSIQMGCLWALLGGALQAGASNIETMLVGRIFGGVAIGVLSMTVPLYNTEIAPPKNRGFLVGLTQQMIGIGFIVANWVGYGCSFMDTHVSWRLPLGLQLVPAGILLVGIQFLPYSPRWLLEVGRDEEARQVVNRIYGTSTPEQQAKADAAYTEMYDTIKAEVFVRSRDIRDLVSTPAMIRRTLVAVGVQVMGQFTGINVINYFGPDMYAALGIVGSKGLLVQGIYGAIGPIFNLFFIIFALDRVGRKKPLMFGAASFIVTFSILAAIVASYPVAPAPADGSAAPPVPSNVAAAQRAGIAMIFLTSVCFSLSFGPVSWVLASEVFPTSTRSIGTAVATCSNWAFNVMISQVSPIGMKNIGYKFYIVFVILNTVDLGLITFFFPETKGKTLEEMAEVFGDAVDASQVLDQHGQHKAESLDDEKPKIHSA